MPPGQVHLSELIEACDNDLDAASTADLSQSGLVMLFWLMVRLKPTVSVGSLRVGWYTDLNTLCRNKYMKLVANPATGVQDVMTQIKAQASLDDQFIEALCQTQGWDAQWMAVPAKAGKGKGRGKAGAAGLPPGQHVLPFQAAPPKASPVAVNPPAPAKAAGQMDAGMAVAVNPVPPKIMAPGLGAHIPPPVPAPVAKSGSIAPDNAAHSVPVAKAVNIAPAPVPPPAQLGGGNGGGHHDVVGELLQPVGSTDAASDEVLGDGQNAGASTLASATLGAVPKAGGLPVPPNIAENAAETVEQDELMEAELEQVFGVPETVDDGTAVEKILCSICQDEIKHHPDAANPEEEVLALQCGHVYHNLCLSKTWSIGGWPRGWCPQRCLDHILLGDRMGGAEIVIDAPASGDATPGVAVESRPQAPFAAAPSSGSGCGVPRTVAALSERAETVVVDGSNIAL